MCFKLLLSYSCSCWRSVQCCRLQSHHCQVSQDSSSWWSELAGRHRISKVYPACRPGGWQISPLCSKTVIYSWEFWECEKPGDGGAALILLDCLIFSWFVFFWLTVSSFFYPHFLYSASALSLLHYSSFFVSSPRKKTLLTTLKSQQTKPWTTGNKLPSTDYRLKRGFVSRNM